MYEKYSHNENILAAFLGMYVSLAKHSYAWLPRKCDYQSVTTRQTDAGQSESYVPLCFADDPITMITTTTAPSLFRHILVGTQGNTKLMPWFSMHTTTAPLLFRPTLVGTQGRTKLIPWLSMYSPIFSAICWSKPRRSIDRTMIVTSSPIPCRKPPHSSDTYDAPTISVLPGQ